MLFFEIVQSMVDEYTKTLKRGILYHFLINKTRIKLTGFLSNLN